MTNVTTFDAAKLATSYYDAMRMVSEQSTFHLPVGVTPRLCLDTYLTACEKAGVVLHNEHWLKNAESVVEKLTEQRREFWNNYLRS